MSAVLTLKYAEAAYQAATLVEKMLPQGTPGQVKLQAALDLITDIDEEAKTVVPVITKLIARIVAILNVAGIFQKKTS